LIAVIGAAGKDFHLVKVTRNCTEKPINAKEGKKEKKHGGGVIVIGARYLKKRDKQVVEQSFLFL